MLLAMLKPQTQEVRSQRVCPFCGLITPRAKRVCLECGQSLSAVSLERIEAKLRIDKRDCSDQKFKLPSRRLFHTLGKNGTSIWSAVC
jgi:predicted amidophosphoribosyltransferase